MSYTVDAVDTALDVLFLVAQQSGLGVTELAKRCGITKARAFRLLTTLEQKGLVQRQGDSATYSLSYRAISLGAAAKEQLSLVRVANICLPAITARCNESTLVFVRDGYERVSVANCEATHAVRVMTPVGARLPIHVGASGKLLLAYAPDEVQKVVLSADLQRVTSRTIVQRGKLEKELSKIKKQGYSTSFGEGGVDTVAVSAPICDATGVVVAALSIVSTSTRITEKNLQRFIDFVQAGAHDISTNLGYVGAGRP